MLPIETAEHNRSNGNGHAETGDLGRSQDLTLLPDHPRVIDVADMRRFEANLAEMFEALAPDGGEAKLETLYSVTPAREAYTKEGDPQPHRHVKNDTPWLVGAWAPDDRPGVCAVAAQWRLNDDKAELYFWEEAKECPKDALPKYQAKADKKPPPLVGR